MEKLHRPKLATAYRKYIKPSEVFCHEEELRSGIPDISINANNRTLWNEVKYVDRLHSFESKGIQLVKCIQLSHVAYGCWYVTFDAEGGFIYISHPLAVKEGHWRKGAIFVVEPIRTGFNYRGVALWMKGCVFNDEASN